MFSLSGNCQWYIRQYNVKDINQLSQEQLNEALIRAKNGKSSGAVISIISGIAIAGGIIMATRDSPYPGDIEGNVTGVLLLAGSIPFEIIGLIVMGTNSTYEKRIKEVLKSTELKMGLINCKREFMFSGSQISILPCLSATILF
jgi:hypothetical protein